MFHSLKIEKTWADRKLRGDKLFEIRLNDRGFQRGDLVQYNVIESVDNPTVVDSHPLSQCLFEVMYVQWYKGLMPGYVVFGERLVPSYEKQNPRFRGCSVGDTRSKEPENEQTGTTKYNVND